jgi:Protein of unknown function (DUF3039)
MDGGSRGSEERAVTTMPEPGTGTTVEERPDLRTDHGDHDKFAHYVPKDKLTAALIEGTPVRALCGKLWTPFGDPKGFPVCPQCKEIWSMMRDDGPSDPDA